MKSWSLRRDVAATVALKIALFREQQSAELCKISCFYCMFLFILQKCEVHYRPVTITESEICHMYCRQMCNNRYKSAIGTPHIFKCHALLNVNFVNFYEFKMAAPCVVLIERSTSLLVFHCATRCYLKLRQKKVS